MRAVGHQPPDLAEVARRGEPAGDDHQDVLLGQPLDLLEDVRGEQDRPALGGHRPQQLHHVQALARVHPVERLVEEQDRRVVDQRRGDLRPLAHALRVGPDRAVLGVAQLDDGDRPVGRGSGVGQRLEPGVEQRELAAGQERIDRLALRDEADLAVDRRVAPGGLAADDDPAGRRPEQPGHEVEQGRLAGAVRPEQAGDPRAQPERDVVDRDDVAVPARDVLELDGGRRVERPGRARSRPARDAARGSGHAPARAMLMP